MQLPLLAGSRPEALLPLRLELGATVVQRGFAAWSHAPAVTHRCAGGQPRTSSALVSQPSSEIGAKLRELRLERGYSLAKVAKGTGISKSFIAFVEAGKSDITITRLMRLTLFYGVRIADILPDETANTTAVVRRGEGQRIHSPEERFDVVLLSRLIDRVMSPVLETFAPEAESEVSTHEGEEFIYVVSGRFEFRLEREAAVVAEGDSMHFSGSRPHSCRNIGDHEGMILSVVTPAIF